MTVQASPLGTGTGDLAFAAATSRRDRSLLTVWSEKQEVRYEEVVEGEVELVTSDPAAPDAPSFLLGGDGVLWRYRPAEERDG